MTTLLEEVVRLAKAHHLEDPFGSQSALRRYLEFWWCQKFNRPLKDPMLSQYTLTELTYEFFRHYYSNPENDPQKEIESKKRATEDEEWIRKQMQAVKPPVVPPPAAPEKQEEIPKEMPPDISTKFE